MSYEGEVQLLCPKGHYWSEDCNDHLLEGYTGRCPEKRCGEKPVWSNGVDDTNCDSVGWIDINKLALNTNPFQEDDGPRLFRIPSEEETVALRTIDHWLLGVIPIVHLDSPENVKKLEEEKKRQARVLKNKRKNG